MIGALVIVFREVLEAALVIGVVAAAVKGLPRRGRYVTAGVALGVAGAAAVAAGIDVLSRLAHGTGQELFEAGVLGAAGLMLAWHNVWMAEHGREMTSRLKSLGGEVAAGNEPVTVLVAVTALAVMREGSEVALFLFGIAASGAGGMQLLGGSLIGLACGASVGFVLFAGLSRIPLKRLFQVSGIVILLIAAGMLARGIEFLVQSGYLPALVPNVWNTSWLLSGQGILGRSLGALVGYTPTPSLTQVIAWLGSFAVIGGAMLIKSGRVRLRGRHAGAAALVVLSGLPLLLLAPRARAGDYKVYSPTVTRGETELEARGWTSGGAGPEAGARKGAKVAVGHTFTNRWATEVYATAEQEYGETLKLEEFEWENRFQLTPQGKYWADVGIVNENEIPRFSHDPYQVKLGPSIEKDFGRVTATLNLLAAHQYGSNAAPGVELSYRARAEYRWRPRLSPVVEAYGEPVGTIGNYGRPRNQVGPGLTGRVLTGGTSSLRYSVVVLFGASHAAASDTVVARLEYEFY
ncbi:MAG TPA: FTR1 family protein [Gammaproteobacteria bacterium]|nr:FTR1 family protein [Gammaproteobacteria bacterium]